LPVLLNNPGGIFNTEADDDLISTASSLNWEEIGEAVTTEPNSSVWKTTTRRLAGRFIESYSKAEAVLLEAPKGEGESPKSSSNIYATEGAAGEPEDDDRGLLEIAGTLEPNISKLREIADGIAPQIRALGATA